ncbi:hypothetical protein ACTGNK_07400 [Bifidobacterium longum]
MRATLETVSCGELTAVYRKDSDTRHRGTGIMDRRRELGLVT